MPITGPASYVPTTDEFLAHWSLANAVVPASPVVVAPSQGGGVAVTRIALANLGGELALARTAVQVGLNGTSVARETVLIAKRELLEHYDSFAAKLRAYYINTPFLPSLPTKPTEGELSARFVDAMDDMASLWTRLNAAGPPPGVTLPLVLAGGYSLGDMQDAMETLRAQLAGLAQAEQDTNLARAKRNLVQGKIYPILRDYRLAVPAMLGKNSPLTATLPRLSPLPGNTPTAVSSSGTFLTPSNQAKVLHSLSPDTDIVRYELRQCPPPDYEGDDETIVASHAANAPAEFLTNFGLLAPGDRSLFKVYAINADDREKGSNVVDITWPAG